MRVGSTPGDGLILPDAMAIPDNGTAVITFPKCQVPCRPLRSLLIYPTLIDMTFRERWSVDVVASEDTPGQPEVTTRLSIPAEAIRRRSEIRAIRVRSS